MNICPNCGYCPHCGRHNGFIPPLPQPYVAPQPWITPIWNPVQISNAGNYTTPGYTVTVNR